MDRGDTYRVEYLGSATLTHMATGLGVLQRPLRQLYFKHCQRRSGDGENCTAAERHLVITHSGMTVSHADGPSDSHYPMACILYWDAVRFATVGSTPKKLCGAFEPLDNDHSRNTANLFEPLDKKLACLRQMAHPALFACVLRRTVGVKALDVHAFVCASERCALGLVRALTAAQGRRAQHEARQSGVFGYSPFARDVSEPPPAVTAAPLPAAVTAGTARGASAPGSQPTGRTKVYQLSQEHFAPSAAATAVTTPAAVTQQPDDHMYQRLILTPARRGRPRAASPERRNDATTQADDSPPRPGAAPRSPGPAVRPTQLAPDPGRHGRLLSPPAAERERRLSRREMGSLAAHAHFGSSPAIHMQRGPDDDRPTPAPPQRDSAPRPAAAASHTPADPPARPVAMVQPHKVHGVKVLPPVPVAGRVVKSPLPGSLPPPHRPACGALPAAGSPRSAGDGSSFPGAAAPRRTQSQYFPGATPRVSPRVSPLGVRDSQSSLLKPVGDRSLSAEQPIPTGKHFLLTQKKDAEIAGLVKNMRMNYENRTLSPGTTNFEKSLGYFP